MSAGGFEGENYGICHSIRFGRKYPRSSPTESLDVVIVGGGISGLVSAFKLKDKLEVKVIEKEPFPGGSSKRGEWNGIYYSMGAADTGPPYEVEIEGKKVNFLGDLYEELGIHWKRVPGPTFAFKYGNEPAIIRYMTIR